MMTSDYRAARKRLRMPHRELGDRLGISAVTSSHYGWRIKPSDPVAKLLALLEMLGPEEFDRLLNEWVKRQWIRKQMR